MTQALHNTVVITQVGKSTIVGLVHVLRSADGVDFPVFFTGYQDKAFPMVFMVEGTDPAALRLELTGKTPIHGTQRDEAAHRRLALRSNVGF